MDKKNIKKFLIYSGSSLKSALSQINKNGEGICFVISKSNILLGVLTDGDIRRNFLKGTSLFDVVDNLMNINFTFCYFDQTESEIRKKLKNNIKYLPLLDRNHKIVDLADNKKSHYIPIIRPILNGNEQKYLLDCIRSNWISSQGQYVIKFENIFSKIHNNYYSLAVSNGTVALQLALLSIGIKKGDEVIVPDITFVATINAVIYCNAIPVICEINKDTWCIEPKEIEKLITPKTKAIIPVHLYGQFCDLNKILKISKKYKLKVIEDCAEAIGTKKNFNRVGTFSEVATFSFFGNKTITTGEGGMVIFKEKKVSEMAKILRDHGMNQKKKYWHDVVGYNFRLTNMQAAIGLAQMERLDEIVKKKIKIAEYYYYFFNNNKYISKLPYFDKSVINSNWLFTIILKKEFDRDLIMKELLQLGIDCRPMFYPIHLMPPYKKYLRSNSLQNSISISLSGISLPTSIDLKKTQIKFITDSFNEVMKNQ